MKFTTLVGVINSFQEKGICLFGKRCNFRHIIKEKRLFNYDYILMYTCNEIYNEINKKENKDSSVLKIYKRILLNRKIIMYNIIEIKIQRRTKFEYYFYTSIFILMN